MPRGQRSFEPTPEQRKLVQVLAANGTSQMVIARNVGPRGIDEKTLRKHFAEDLANGRSQVVASIGATVVKAALAGNMHAAKYWLSTHRGQSERSWKSGRLAALRARRRSRWVERRGSLCIYPTTAATRRPRINEPACRRRPAVQ